MKVGQALQRVMSRWNITGYRLAQLSGVGAATIGKLIRGDMEYTSWSNMEKFADAFRRIDTMAVGAFFELLRTPEENSYLPPATMPPSIMPLDREEPNNIAEVVLAMHELGFVDREEIAKLVDNQWRKVPAMMRFSLEDVISLKMQEMRRLEEQKNESEN